MTNDNIFTEERDGLAWYLYSYLRYTAGMDTGLAVGATLEILHSVASQRDYHVPGIAAIRELDHQKNLKDLPWQVMLVGPEQDCKYAIKCASWIQGQVLGMQYYSSIGFWSGKTDPPGIPLPGDGWVDGPFLIGASGRKEQKRRDNPAFTLGDLREIAQQPSHPIEIRIDRLAREKVRSLCLHMARNLKLYGDPGPTIRRLMNVLALMAIGRDSMTPYILLEALQPALEIASTEYARVWESWPPPPKPSPHHLTLVK